MIGSAGCWVGWGRLGKREVTSRSPAFVAGGWCFAFSDNRMRDKARFVMNKVHILPFEEVHFYVFNFFPAFSVLV